MIDIIQAVKSSHFFQPAFKDLRSWKNWLVFLKALYALPMEPTELEAYTHFSGRTAPPTVPFEEAWVCCGRRGGKSRIASLIATYEALTGEWKERLSGGEQAWVFLLAVDKAQASLIYSYIRHLLSLAAPDQIARETSDTLDLKNGVSISVRAGSLRGLRGYALAMGIIDEACFIRDIEGGSYANPLQEIYNSIEPSLIQQDGDRPGGKLVSLSTPFGKFGLMYEKFQSEWGVNDSDVLCWHGTTKEMNPDFSQHKIDRAIKKDRMRAEAEYLALWREDVSNFLEEWQLRESSTRMPEIPDPSKRYAAFIDPSSGKGDSFTMAIGYRDGERIIIARAEERLSPFTPSTIVAEFAAILKAYGLSTATSDTHASGWVEDAFRKLNVLINITKTTKSSIYLQFAGLLAMGKLSLLQSDRATAQFLALERRVERSGLERVDHPAYGGQMDDLANAIAGCCVTIGETRFMTPAEMEAMLPVLGKPRDGAIRKLSATDEMDQFMRGRGCSKIIKRS